MKSLLIQGWRGINHSYAMVNQYQMLELLKRSGLTLYHQDLPFYQEFWNRNDNRHGFGPEDAARLDAVPPPPEGLMTDIIYRIAFPYRLHGGDSRKVLCFGTSELQIVEPSEVYGGPEAAQRYANDDFEIVTPSHWSKLGFLKAGFREEAVHVVPHGVDPAVFSPLSEELRAQMRARIGLKPGAFAFLNVGAMTGNKGIDVLVLAFAQIRKKHPHAFLLLKDQSKLYQIGARKAVKEALTKYPGRIGEDALGAIRLMSANMNHAALRSLYGASDAYISPYRAEGFNLPPLEAAACGVPIAVTAGGATDDYAHPSFALKIAGPKRQQDAKTYIEPDLDSLIDCMEMLIEKRAPDLNPAAGIAWIAEHFSWAKAVDKLAALFEA